MTDADPSVDEPHTFHQGLPRPNPNRNPNPTATPTHIAIPDPNPNPNPNPNANPNQGLPPEVGTKYAANVWVHNYDYRTAAGKGCLLTHKNTH